MKLSPKFFVVILLFSIPFNYIAIEGIGNLYVSTLVIILEFLLLILITKGSVLLKQNALFAILIFIITLIVTIINIIFYDTVFIDGQITNTVIYLQVLIVFIIASYFYDKIKFSYFIHAFLLVIFFATVRVFIEEPNHIFMLSTEWEERIEAFFIGGVNNYALFLGLAFILSFFYITNRTLKILLCLYFLIMIILTMSRGALLGVILTLFITSFYDTNRATLKLLIKYSAYIMLSGLFFLYVTGRIDEIVSKIQIRFFSLFTGELGTNEFFSGRGDLIQDMLIRLSNSSFFQIIFGHGNGGIKFYNKASLQFFETSHNILIDILFRNGVLLLLFYILIFIYILIRFFNNRQRDKLALFGVFIFFHLELLVNPVLFAAQVGWIYAIFMVYFLKQDCISPWR